MLGIPKIDLKLETGRIAVLAGESSHQVLRLVNLTVLPDDFDLKIEDLPEEWFSFDKASVNLFPNWNETVQLTVTVAPRTLPNRYSGRIVATSRTQPGLRAEAALEIEVLMPLEVEARIQPQRATGHKVSYDLTLRNRSMREGTIGLLFVADNNYCRGDFSAKQVSLAPGQAYPLKLKVQLGSKVPKEQIRQPHNFKVVLQPQWYINNQLVARPPVEVQGQYNFRSRWTFLAAHPWLYGITATLLIFVLLWSVLILPLIQNALLLSVDGVSYQGTARSSLRVEQNSFSDTINNNYNPFGAIVKVDMRFSEANQSVEIIEKSFFLTINMTGRIEVDAVSGDISFRPDKAGQPNSFPWFFVPPDRVVQKLNGKVKQWLNAQNPRQRIVKAEIEGNTLFLRLKTCSTNDSACSQ